ncbi:MAG: hypothetical protein JWO38_120 [Gemmataceae bacterium]|nr:hypothetical protein [Gemmataceae bacterium]
MIAGPGCGARAPVEVTEAQPVAVPPKSDPTTEPARPVAPPPRPVEADPGLTDNGLTNIDAGLKSNLAKGRPEIDQIAEKTVDAIPVDPYPVEPPVVPGPFSKPVDVKSDKIPPELAAPAFLGRTGATKAKLLNEFGGNDESERVVVRGLAWLARQQKKNGSWAFDGSSSDDTIAATGMALLPFLAAGETPKTGKKYPQTLDRGLKYLISNMNADGKFSGKGITMYSQGIATLALCEAYGMTKDKSLLKPAQAAVDFIVANQAGDGSWGYAPGTAGDTSIVGWQVQALKAAQLAKDIVVPDAAIKKAIGFLDKVASGEKKAVYGYAGPNGAPGTALTSVGLLCRYFISKWGPGNAGLAEGVEGLMKRGPQKAPTKPDLYYYYYATQVVRFNEGPEWKDWNEGPTRDGKREGGMRDWLVNLQNKTEGSASQGSWDPDGATIGGSCGRVGTTALSLLTLEVYYRHLPLNKLETDKRPKP